MRVFLCLSLSLIESKPVLFSFRLVIKIVLYLPSCPGCWTYKLFFLVFFCVVSLCRSSPSYTQYALKSSRHPLLGTQYTWDIHRSWLLVPPPGVHERGRCTGHRTAEVHVQQVQEVRLLLRRLALLRWREPVCRPETIILLVRYFIGSLTIVNTQ